MKSKKQIVAWLKVQPWYEDFVFNCVKRSKELSVNAESLAKHINHKVSGELGVNVIFGSFVWKDTPQGHEFWKEVNTEFHYWYEKELTFDSIEVFKHFYRNRYSEDTIYFKISDTEACNIDDIIGFLPFESIDFRGKTAEQVVEYLSSKEWYLKYLKNIAIQTCDESFIAEVVKGNFLRDSISGAFGWSISKEGWDFWSKIDKAFEVWYDTQSFACLPKNAEFWKNGIQYRKINDTCAVIVCKIVCIDKKEPVTLLFKEDK